MDDMESDTFLNAVKWISIICAVVSGTGVLVLSANLLWW